jgi:hypothetical protein
MWLTGRLVRDHKTIADFRKDNGGAIRKVCARFILLCRAVGLFGEVSVAIDGSKFKAVNNRDKNFTRAKMERRMAQIEESVVRYLRQLDSADRQEPSEARTTKTARLKEKIAKLKEEMQRLHGLKARMLATADQQISLTDPDSRSMATSGRGSGVVGYNVQVAVDTENHLIIAHQVSNVGSDRAQLARMAKETKATLERSTLDVIADRGLLQQRRDPRMRQSWYHGHVAKAHDLESKAFRQAGLPLRSGGGCLRLSCWRAAHPLIHNPRAWIGVASLSNQRLQVLRHQTSLYHRQGATDHTMGA